LQKIIAPRRSIKNILETSTKIRKHKMDCLICCETYSKQDSFVKCLECKQDVCRPCVKHYLLDSIDDANCMCCKKEWSVDFLFSTMSKGFIWKEHREHRENVLMDRQMSMMAESQVFATRIAENKRLGKRNKKYKRRMVKSEIIRKKLDIKIKDLENKIFLVKFLVKDDDALKKNKELQSFERERKKHAVKKQKISAKFPQRQNKIWRNRTKIWGNKRFVEIGNVDAKEKDLELEEKNKGHCPAKDCNGFIEKIEKEKIEKDKNGNIKKEWACGICRTKICLKCLEIKSSKKVHECDENVVENVKLIRKETKPCPGCSVRVHRDYGCNLMWCTRCQVSFDWSSGKAVKVKNNHNPHYIEWAQKNGGDLPGMNPEAPVVGICGINPAALVNIKVSDHYDKRLKKELRIAYQVRDEVARGPDFERKQRDLRIKFLVGDVDKKYFKTFIQRSFKAQSKLGDANNVRDMYADTCLAIFQSLITESTELEKINSYIEKSDKTKELVSKKLKEIETLKTYVETCMDKIGFTYNSQDPHISTIEFMTESREKASQKRLDKINNKMVLKH
jgi:hypothetical protein